MLYIVREYWVANEHLAVCLYAWVHIFILKVILCAVL